MQYGLFDVLYGKFNNGMPIEQVNEREHRLLSVMGNLERLFNSRQGAIEHLPDYGLPDVSMIYRDMPYSIDWMRKSMEDAVKKYEPRLNNVRVSHQKTGDYSMRLEFILRGKLDNRDFVRFQTTFSSDSLVFVRQLSRDA